ncbi:SUKH-4 family immunity protein [Streptomyces sp. NPDC006530]|uniref:SUKH-4 family immunity protein n=1 Tax=Streptomyces sp. NPDC006530 TaxID=3364750 RepID=UPI0036CEDEE9
MSEHHEAVARALSQPLDLLVAAEHQAAAASGNVSAWQLPSADKTVLARWGLPLIEECRLIPNIQEGMSPEMNVRGRQFYTLGLFADHEIGALVKIGEVRGIPLNQALPESFINSSVAQFVETSWRWYWVWKEVNALRFDIAQYDILDSFLDFATKLDPPVGTAETSLWRGLIESW